MQTRILKQFLIGTTLALAASLALASPGKGNPGERLAERLDLSDSQRVELNELFEQHQSSMQEVREQRKEAREQLHESIRALLTAEQAERFDEMRARHDRGERGHGGHHGHKGKAGACRGMRESGEGPGFDGIDLSEDQRAELEAMHEAHREEMQSLREAHHEQVREILTEEQYEQLRSKHGHDKRGGHNRHHEG
ncbi:MAG: Spy/CpxP family protein refolding chaperone [Wenzhouxiangella sp.]